MNFRTLAEGFNTWRADAERTRKRGPETDTMRIKREAREQDRDPRELKKQQRTDTEAFKWMFRESRKAKRAREDE